jgi:hypothetical protein
MRRVLLIVALIGIAVWFGFGKSLVAKGKGAVGKAYRAAPTVEE